MALPIELNPTEIAGGMTLRVATPGLRDVSCPSAPLQASSPAGFQDQDRRVVDRGLRAAPGTADIAPSGDVDVSIPSPRGFCRELAASVMRFRLGPIR